MLLQVSDDEPCPADLVLLWSALPGRVAYIKTTNLDGESNLKLRSTVNGLELKSFDEALSLNGRITCEVPNVSLAK